MDPLPAETKEGKVTNATPNRKTQVRFLEVRSFVADDGFTNLRQPDQPPAPGLFPPSPLSPSATSSHLRALPSASPIRPITQRHLLNAPFSHHLFN